MKIIAKNELLKKYPYLEKHVSNVFVLSIDDFIKIKSGPKVDCGSESISNELLKLIFKTDFLVESLINQENGLSFSYLDDCNLGYILTFSKRSVISGIEILIEKGELSLSEIDKKNLKTIKSQISLETFEKKFGSKKISLCFNDCFYNYHISDLLRIIQLPHDRFVELLQDKNLGYIINFFFHYYHLLDGYKLPDQVYANYQFIKNNFGDYLPVMNPFFTTNNQQINLNDQLKNVIFENMPDNLNDLEKAIYIYIKMCKLFVYNEEYYVLNQQGVLTEKHQSIDFISQITCDNNAVTCFEFNRIYARLLNDLGICTRINCHEMYGAGHENLEVIVDNFLVRADAVKSIFRSDLTYAKLNMPLHGLNCLSDDPKKQQDFNTNFSRVYQLINKSNNLIHDFGELIISDELPDNLEKRLFYILEKVKLTNLKGIDLISLIIHLVKMFFTEEDIAFTIVRNNQLKPCIVFSLQNNQFFYNDLNNDLQPISPEVLLALFDNHVLEYIDSNNCHLPGINSNDRLKRSRKKV